MKEKPGEVVVSLDQLLEIARRAERRERGEPEPGPTGHIPWIHRFILNSLFPKEKPDER